MIQIIAKNNFLTQALIEALKDFDPQPYDPSELTADILVIFDTQTTVDSLLKNPINGAIVLIGTHHEEADLELEAPCVLPDLKIHIQNILNKQKNAPSFENKHFLFEGSYRRIIDKKTKKEVRLTEKENDLIIYLVKKLPNSALKTDLLIDVWNYRPDIETHTVETHIYTLRQKIGEDSDTTFIANTADGYTLVDDLKGK